MTHFGNNPANNLFSLIASLKEVFIMSAVDITFLGEVVATKTQSFLFWNDWSIGKRGKSDPF